MAKALIVYSTRTGDTLKIAELIAEGLRFSAVDVTLMDVKDVKKAADLAGYDAYVFGAPTYHGEMTAGMKTFLFLAEKAELAGKVGGAFGAFGWSGEAPERIFETMARIFNMSMADGPLMLKSAGLEGGLKMAQNYGRQIGQKIT